MSSADIHNLREPTSRLRPEETTFPRGPEPMRTEFAASTFLGEAMGGLAAIVLAIIGLAGTIPATLAAITAIVLGAALLARGSSVAARFSRLFGDREFAIGGEFFGGAAIIVLGVLSLLGMVPTVLLPVSAIVLGAVMLLSSGTMARLHAMTREQATVTTEMGRRSFGGFFSAANSADALVGAAAVVLGIVGLVHALPVTLTLVAFLVAGAGVAAAGSACAGRMGSWFGV
jgi:hypothetical protein